MRQLSISQVGILYNPIAGRGLARQASEKAAAHLMRSGFNVSLRELIGDGDDAALREFIAVQDLVVIAGGDGTVRSLLGLLTATIRPIYVLPVGNESLFSRLFKMPIGARELVRRIRLERFTGHYVGRVNGERFFHMVTIGLDAAVVRRVDQFRTGKVHHWGYLIPTLKELFSYRAPDITVTVDGQRAIERRPGFLIVANTPEYALRLNPVTEASSGDRQLAARFFSVKKGFGYLRILLCLKWRREALLAQSELLYGKNFTVEATGGSDRSFQADGDYVGENVCEIAWTEDKILVLGEVQPQGVI